MNLVLIVVINLMFISSIQNSDYPTAYSDINNDISINGTYVGCFENIDVSKDFYMTNDKMVIGKCWYYCYRMNMPIAALSNGGNCNCIDSKFLSNGPPVPNGYDCTQTCSGDSNTICGGLNSYSVFSLTLDSLIKCIKSTEYITYGSQKTIKITEPCRSGYDACYSLKAYDRAGAYLQRGCTKTTECVNINFNLGLSGYENKCCFSDSCNKSNTIRNKKNLILVFFSMFVTKFIKDGF